jgi:hypothetical protein
MHNTNAVEVVGRSRKGGFAPVQNTSADALTVWGLINGHAFRRVFPSARAWRAWRAMQRSTIEVRGMQSGEVR